VSEPGESAPASSSRASTRGILVEVEARYVPERSQPKQGRWFFAYHVRISNRGSERVQLLSRHWIISDANGRTEEVRGPGVVGEQPVLGPGASFEYTSFCPLETPFGSMTGSYQMETSRGERFDAEIAPFSLLEPYAIN
jgi:ApaG protein